MSIRMTKSTEVTVGTFQGSLQNGVSVSKLETTLSTLNLNDNVAVAKEVDRCNDRCRDNDVDVDIKALKTAKGGATTIQTINAGFRIS